MKKKLEPKAGPDLTSEHLHQYFKDLFGYETEWLPSVWQCLQRIANRWRMMNEYNMLPNDVYEKLVDAFIKAVLGIHQLNTFTRSDDPILYQLAEKTEQQVAPSFFVKHIVNPYKTQEQKDAETLANLKKQIAETNWDEFFCGKASTPINV